MVLTPRRRILLQRLIASVVVAMLML